MSKHENDCECMGCQEGMEAVREWTKNAIRENGFAIHYVPELHMDGCRAVNVHTHGFRETWDHPDLQIVVPLDPDVCRGIFWAVADRVKEGEEFRDGQVAERVIGGGLRVKFVAVQSDEPARPLMRILLPGPNGVLPGEEGCDPAWEFQATIPERN